MGQVLFCCRAAKEEELLPHDVVFSILARLPVKTLLRFRSVSKLWNETIARNIYFVAEHQKYYSVFNVICVQPSSRCQRFIRMETIKQDKISVTQLECPFRKYGRHRRVWYSCVSCHGLLCVVVTSHMDRNIFIVIWNPATRRYREIGYPKEFYDGIIKENAGLLGFGYDPITSDYKILVLDAGFVHPPPQYSLLRIMSLKTNTWKTKAIINEDHFGHRRPRPVSLEETGDIYWMILVPINPRLLHGSKYFLKLFKFNFAAEKLNTIPLPCPMATQKYAQESDCCCQIDSHKGLLHLYSLQNKENAIINIWKLGRGSSSSWSKLATISTGLAINHQPEPSMGFTSDGDFILILERGCVIYKVKENKLINLAREPYVRYLNVSCAPLLQFETTIFP